MQDSKQGAEPSKKNKRPSRDRILKSAEQLFASQPYGDTSLRQLMAAASISTTAFYARFRSKEEVLVALIDDLMISLHQEALIAFDPKKPADQLIKRALDALVRTLAARKSLVSIALAEGMVVQGVRDALARAYHGLVEIIAGRMGRETAHSNALAWVYVGALQMQVMRWAVFDELSEAELKKQLKAVTTALTAPMNFGN